MKSLEQLTQDFGSYSRRENRRIVSDVTVSATPKMIKKTSQLFKLFHARS